ncbi:MAG: XTP/dITP diphosphatase [Pseudomonadota bacterium]
MPELLIATQNRGKVKEISAFFASVRPDLTCLALADLDPSWNVIENGATFLENARKKGIETAKRFGKITLADDTGLLVDRLDGRPGVYSSRYANSDAEKVERLLGELRGIPKEKRTARFECVMVLAQPDGKTAVETGTVEGTILESPRGTDGFGFDPVFWIPELQKTLAEISTDEKNRISHRAKALRKIARHLV